jgi:hypothetical protein
VTEPIEALDAWLRSDFIRINTALEEAYFAERVDLIRGRPALDELKLALLRGGAPLMRALAAMPYPRIPESAIASWAWSDTTWPPANATRPRSPQTRVDVTMRGRSRYESVRR